MRFFAQPLSRKGRFWLSLALFPTVLTSLIALLSPNNILEEIPPLYSLMQFWAGIIPSMHGYMGLSSFSQVTGAFFAVGWTLLPMQMIAWLMAILEIGDVDRLRSSQFTTLAVTRKKALYSSAGGIILTSVGLLFLPKDPSFIGNHGINHSRLGLAFFGGFSFAALCLSFWMFFYILRFTKKGDF